MSNGPTPLNASGGKETTDNVTSASNTNSVGVGSSSGDIVSETRAASQGQGSATTGSTTDGRTADSSIKVAAGKGGSKEAEAESSGSGWGTKKSFVDVSISLHE